MDRTIILTGASRGLGLSLARKLVEDQDVVIGISRTRRNWIQARATVCNPGLFQLCQLDLTLEREVRSFVAHMRKKIKEIDVLINNAGYGGTLGRVEETSLFEFQKHLSTNLLSAFLMCKHMIPIFLKQGSGLIINIASLAGKRAVPKLAGYSASKFGLVALSQAIAKENQKTKLKCITVCPGGINTQMRADLFGHKDAALQQSPDDVAAIIIDLIDGKIKVDSGADILIRHGRVVAVHPAPTF